MPRFSIIVPTHGVPGRLADCLASVLGQSFADLEVIAVVDAPGTDADHDVDHSAAIVAEHAERDPRVRRTQSPPAEGLPGARNAGSRAAEGDYLLFLDGDDTLTPGTLAALDARLGRAGEPDLLLFDHERVHWFEGGQGPALTRLWQGAPEGTFTAAGHAALPDPLVPAFSAAYRRSFLTGHGLSFAPGMFTDTVWSVQTALRAERIAVLDRVCVRHLLRRQGARNRTAGAHHLELLDQFGRAMEGAVELGVAAPVLARLFRRLTHEVLKTASLPRRLPSGRLRRRFFRQATRLYRLHRPEGFRPPAGSLGVQHRLLGAGAYGTFCLLRGLKSRAQKAVSTLRRYRAKLARRLPGADVYAAFLKQPVDENLAVFSAYWGRGYTCNPAAIHAKARELAPHIRCVFLVDEEHADGMPDGVECAVTGSRRYWEVMARAKYTFNNVNFEGRIRKRPGTVHVQTQHGTPLKHMGVDQAAYPAAAAGIGPFGKMLTRTDRWDYNLSANRHSTEVWERAFPSGFEQLEYGYPRNDAYYASTADDVRRIRRALGVAEDRTAVLYAPTHRDYREGFAAQLDLAAFCDALDDTHVVLLRAHHFYEGSPGLEEAVRAGKLIDVTAHRSTEEICLAADALITDYSSIMFDYANLDRPIVVYADDWDVYRESRGVYFDLPAHPPGPVATTLEELVGVFRGGALHGERSRQRRAAFRERFCAFDDGHAAERVVRRVLLGEEPGEILPPMPLHVRVPAPTPARALTH
ncbi:bifunctional glycosyltransferase/CDP-glycerol:glycerophosphate glycerophosphotransferase [Streptomyces luteocolor]|uniref:bifunctional glycosyltransferase/CDP-glycerol:glycerophosphate glycerophosphotransferase n=1 Tax=Streptomyces luteocolor TaxID=285500 RepID=UPI000853C73D|nr:CDP-glycerol glycerophosphotransferase family protein [Streptomyces luteocolor]